MKPNITLACKKSPCFPPVKTKETKEEIKPKALSFIKLKRTFPITITLKSSSWDKTDDDQNSYRWLKYNIDPFLISTVETLSSVLRFKKCLGTFLKPTTNKETKILLLNN